MSDNVNHPHHYNWHPSGVEVIQITEHLNFCLGNAIKYILRCDHKGRPLEDLEKARWYIDREIARRRLIAEPSNDQLLAEMRAALQRRPARADHTQPA